MFANRHILVTGDQSPTAFAPSHLFPFALFFLYTHILTHSRTLLSLAASFQKTYDFKNIDKFHGTGAFNLTQYPEWDSLLNDLLFQPNDVMIVSAKQRQRGSKDNPYFKKQKVSWWWWS